MRSGFETHEINLAAALALQFPCTTYHDKLTGKALFAFDDIPELRDALFRYEQGALLPAKQLLQMRTRLYHEAARVSGRARS